MELFANKVFFEYEEDLGETFFWKVDVEFIESLILSLNSFICVLYL